MAFASFSNFWENAEKRTFQNFPASCTVLLYLESELYAFKDRVFEALWVTIVSFEMNTGRGFILKVNAGEWDERILDNWRELGSSLLSSTYEDENKILVSSYQRSAQSSVPGPILFQVHESSNISALYAFYLIILSAFHQNNASIYTYKFNMQKNNE